LKPTPKRFATLKGFEIDGVFILFTFTNSVRQVKNTPTPQNKKYPTIQEQILSNIKTLAEK